jgi:cell division transport system ATP-binding protein
MDLPHSAPQATEPAVAFEDVALRYGGGPDVLRDVRFALAAGSFHFLTGPSGSGKSSLLALICLGQLPSDGQVRVLGTATASASRAARAATRRRIGIVFQDFRLFEHLDLVENVALPLRIAGKDPKAHRKDILDLLGWVGLGAHLDAHPSALSGGQRQRLAIARAVVARPPLLVADEPTGNVEAALALRLIYLFEAMHRLGTTVVIATHDTRLASRFAHPALRLEGGRVLSPVATGQRGA